MLKFIFKHFLIEVITEAKVEVIKDKREYEDFYQLSILQEYTIRSMPEWYKRIFHKCYINTKRECKIKI